ncbi:MAG: Na/Pi symporter, partial [Bacteroidota bacterium]
MRSTLQIAFLLLIVLAFFVGLEVIRVTVGVVGAGAARDLVALASNPLVGLFVGVLATALLQSSSTTTALAVTFAGAGVLPFEAAIPIVMGANVGTSITSTAVAFGHVTRTDEFRRAMASATVHDAFNALAVLLLFPIELATGLIARTSELLVQLTSGLGGDAVLRPVSSVVEPIAEAIVGWVPSAWVALLAGLLMLFGALRLLVRLLREVLLERAEQLLDRYVFGTPGVALLCGALVTMLLQSSSITTSIVVPLAGAGILTTRQVFPFVLGANLGTTITAIVVGFLL